MAHLRDVAATIPSPRFAERPAPSEWSAAEVFTHILDMNERGAAAIEGILDHGQMPAALRDDVTGETRPGLHDADDYWRTFQAVREPLLDRVLSARGDEHLEVKITHSWFGDFTWREWLLFMRVHDLDHMRQLQSISAHFAGR